MSRTHSEASLIFNCKILLNSFSFFKFIILGMIKCSKFLYKYYILYTVSNKQIAMQRRNYLKFYNFDIAFIHIIIVRFLLLCIL